jgi:hypothetical protein
VSGDDPTVAASPSRMVSVQGQERRGGGAVDFRRAAAALAEVSSGEASSSPYAKDAAEALLRLAQRNDESRLRQLVRPDPNRDRVTWSVACFGIGDLEPRDLRDFASASAAVVHLSGCGDPGHVASELVASTSDGVRWKAMFRAGRTLVFQLPDLTTCESSPNDRSKLEEAIVHWKERLGGWKENPVADGEHPVPRDVPDGDLVVPDVDALELLLQPVVERLERLEQHVLALTRTSERHAELLERIDRHLRERSKTRDAAFGRRKRELS